jgi:hypothetical protein
MISLYFQKVVHSNKIIILQAQIFLIVFKIIITHQILIQLILKLVELID